MGKLFDTLVSYTVSLPKKNTKLICSDVLCKYWDLKRLGQMKPILHRMHAKAHVWYCDRHVISLRYTFLKYHWLLYFILDKMEWPLDGRRSSYNWKRAGTIFFFENVTVYNIVIKKWEKQVVTLFILSLKNVPTSLIESHFVTI